MASGCNKPQQKTLIDFDYDELYIFDQRFSVVKKNNKMGAVNIKNEIIVPVKYDEAAQNFNSDSMLQVRLNGKFGMYNNQGKEIIQCLYDTLDAYSGDGLIRFLIDDKWGFINTVGKVIVPAIYDEAGIFSEGVAMVRKEADWMKIDIKGNKVDQ